MHDKKNKPERKPEPTYEDLIKLVDNMEERIKFLEGLMGATFQK